MRQRLITAGAGAALLSFFIVSRLYAAVSSLSTEPKEQLYALVKPYNGSPAYLARRALFGANSAKPGVS